MTRIGVVGLDLSLRCSAAVYVPPRWTFGRWSVLRSQTFVCRADEKGPQRLAYIAEGIAMFVRRWGDCAVFVEDYAYGMMAGSASMLQLAELGGAVKARLYTDCKVTARPMNQSTARKLFLGKLPQKDRAMLTHRAIKALGTCFKTADEGDAWVVANAGRSELGMQAVTDALTPALEAAYLLGD
jgi:hypothetical protein